jgi:hypothetical protein
MGKHKPHPRPKTLVDRVFAFLSVIPEGNLLLTTLNPARKWVPHPRHVFVFVA